MRRQIRWKGKRGILSCGGGLPSLYEGLGFPVRAKRTPWPMEKRPMGKAKRPMTKDHVPHEEIKTPHEHFKRGE